MLGPGEINTLKETERERKGYWLELMKKRPEVPALHSFGLNIELNIEWTSDKLHRMTEKT